MIRRTLTAAERRTVADVFTTHRPFVENVARQHATGPESVQDIVQAVGLKLCRGMNGFRGDAAVRTWLYRVTVNESRNHFRAERRHTRIQEAVQLHPVPDQVIDPDTHLIDQERVLALRAGIARLKASYRDLIRNTLQDAPVLDTRRTTRHRARRQLKTLLAGDPRLG